MRIFSTGMFIHLWNSWKQSSETTTCDDIKPLTTSILKPIEVSITSMLDVYLDRMIERSERIERIHEQSRYPSFISFISFISVGTSVYIVIQYINHTSYGSLFSLTTQYKHNLYTLFIQSYSTYQPMFMDTFYTIAYHAMSVYTHIQHYTDKTIKWSCSFLGSLYQSCLANTIEQYASSWKITLPNCLLSESTQMQYRMNEQEYIANYPWIVVMYHPHKKEWYETSHASFSDLTYEYTTNQTHIRFILYRVNYESIVIYRRFITLENAVQWYNQWKTEEEAKQDVIKNYREEHPFLQLTPRSSNYNWKEQVKPFAVKGNMVLDKDFVEWCLHNQEDSTIDDHYPLDYIDCNINMGSIEATTHYVVK